MEYPAYKTETREVFNDGVVCETSTQESVLLTMPNGDITQLVLRKCTAGGAARCLRDWLKAHIDYDREHRKESTNGPDERT